MTFEPDGTSTISFINEDTGRRWLNMSLERTKLFENALLGRREATYLFKESAGMLSRPQAVKIVANDLGVKEDNIVPIAIRGKHGTRDVVGTFYVFEDMKVAKDQLPKYMFLRSMAKDERKKYFEDLRKSKAKKAAPAQKKK
jgi:ribosomal protein S24E